MKSLRIHRVSKLLKREKKRYKRFRQWQRVPHRVKPLSNDVHDCPTCDCHYMGNYCPRCGQSSKIGRYSFKNAFLLFIDVWGLGNRGMFRTLRDIFLRPGYMIADYLRGMQMAYFPPFKMLFLICALAIIIDTGVNIKGINRFEMYMNYEKELAQKRQAEASADPSLTFEKREVKIVANQTLFDIENKILQNNQLSALIAMLLFSGPFYLLFRRSPAIPDLRFSECFVSMVYIANMMIIYTIIPSLLCFDFKTEARFNSIVAMLAIVPIKQLTGYSYWSTIWRLLVALIPFSIILLLLYIITVVFVIISEHPEFLEQ